MKIELIWARRSNSTDGRGGEGQKGLFSRFWMGQEKGGSIHRDKGCGRRDSMGMW